MSLEGIQMFNSADSPNVLVSRVRPSKLMMFSSKTLVVLAMVVTFSATALYAQTFGEISGRVTDASGAVMSGASIALTNTNTNAVRQTTTTDAGVYTFPSVPPGIYTTKTEVAN